MATVKILEEYCKSCGLCVACCPRGALSIGRHINAQGYNPAVFDESRQCSGCGNCTVMCPDAAIELHVPKKAGAAPKLAASKAQGRQ